MDADEGESGLDNKMLYELHNIHAWEQCITEKKPFLKDIVTSSCQQAYQKACNLQSVTPFFSSYPIPSISHDGEYIALVANSTIEIRDKQSSFSLLAEIEVDLQAGSIIKWSSNDHHLGVCTIGSEIEVYDVYGNILETCIITGSRISSFHLSSDQGFSFLMVYDDGMQLSRRTSEKQWYNFYFHGPVLEMMCVSGIDMIITTHLDSTGKVIALLKNMKILTDFFI
jgi:hypothetical protein